MISAKREVIFDRKTGKARAISDSPRLTSGPLGWKGYTLEMHSVPSYEACDVIWMSNVVIVQMNHEFEMEWKNGGRFVQQRIRPGDMSLRPVHATTSSRSRMPTQFLSLTLDPSFVSIACSGMSETNGVELPVLVGIEDRFVEGVVMALKNEVEQNGKSGRIYSESLANSLVVHLYSKYGVRNRSSEEGTFGGSPRLIRRAIEFIHSRLEQDITLKEIADAVGLSPFHFARLFKQTLGVSPYQYVIRQRIERAKQLLARGDQPLSSVAIDVGFYDQSHFTLHFKKVCGLTPRQYALQFRHGRTVAVK